jgi:hypothetical protein
MFHSRGNAAASGQLLDLGVLRLERAVKRLRADDLVGALVDLRLALSHMQRAGADPLSIQHLSAIITDAERGSGC